VPSTSALSQSSQARFEKFINWVPENSPKSRSFEGAESSRGVWDLRINTSMPVRQTTLRLNHRRVGSANLAYRKLKIILWKVIKIEPVATSHWFPEQERSAASTVARAQLGDSGSDKKKTLRGHIIQG
jgi:hypothetical protein